MMKSAKQVMRRAVVVKVMNGARCGWRFEVRVTAGPGKGSRYTKLERDASSFGAVSLSAA